MDPALQILTLLKKLGISYHHHSHPPVFTCSQARQFDSRLNSARTKNLFLKDSKSGQFYLYILECDQRADLKKLARSLHFSPPRLTFASPAELHTHLGLTPGSVSPFGLIHDSRHQVSVLIDRSLRGHFENLAFHPNTNTATLEISWPDFEKFLSHTGHKYSLV